MKHPRMGWRRFVKKNKREREREEMTIASFLGLISGEKNTRVVWNLENSFEKKKKMGLFGVQSRFLEPWLFQDLNDILDENDLECI